MKKSVISFVLCLSLLLSLTVPAFAEEYGEGSTVVSLTVEDPTPQDDYTSGSPEPENSPISEIKIPASFSLDTGDHFNLDFSNVTLKDRTSITISIDTSRTLAPDGYFYLVNASNEGQKIPCLFYRGYASTDYWESMTLQGNYTVAVYENNGEHYGKTYGSLKIETAGSPSSAGSSSVAGTYSGVIYFTIKLESF